MLYLSSDFQMQMEYSTSGKFICEAGGVLHPHRNLDSCVLLLGCEGECYIEQNGVEYVLAPGKFLILFAGYTHRGTRPCKPGSSYYWCHFSMKYELINAAEAAEKISMIHKQADINTYNYTGIQRTSGVILPEFGSVASITKYNLLFHSLIDHSRRMHVHRSRLCDLIIMQLLYELSGEFVFEQTNTGSLKQRALAEKVVEYIRLHAAEIGSVQEVAEHFGYNSEYLTTILRQNTGQTMIEHINRNKVEEAKRLLLNTDCTISEIAQLCGFCDVKYFSKLFHRLTDVSPTQYRNVYCRIHINQ